VLEFYEKLHELLSGNIPFVSVTTVATVGSVPQDPGSKMLVTADGLYYGTVGGGKVEKRAIEEAQAMLSNHMGNESGSGAASRTRFVEWSLNKDIGMTCGGSTKLFFEVYNAKVWNIVVFGAGHCSQALIHTLVNLDCHVTCIDSRQEWLDRLPRHAKVKTVQADDLPKMVAEIPDGSFVILMTMGHTTDKPILLEILRGWDKRTFPYLGVIGSKAKAARLYKDVDEAGLPAEYKKLFHCPMGLPIGSNHPHEIAISIVAQLLQERDKNAS